MLPVVARAVTNDPLCPHLTEDIKATISSHNQTAHLYRVGAIVSAIALTAIFGAVSAVYLGLLAAPSIWVSTVAILSGMGCLKGLDLWHQGTLEFEKAEDALEIEKAYTVISEEVIDEDAIAARYVQIGVPQNDVNFLRNGVSELNKKSPGTPLRALFPLIARLEVEEQRARRLREVVIDNFNKVNQAHPGAPQALPLEAKDELGDAANKASVENEMALPLDEKSKLGSHVHAMQQQHQQLQKEIPAETEQPLSLDQKQELEFRHFTVGVTAYEAFAKKKLDCAILLQNIINPTRTFFYTENEKGVVTLASKAKVGDEAIQGHGELTMKPMQNRIIDMANLPGLIAPNNRLFFTPALLAGPAAPIPDVVNPLSIGYFFDHTVPEIRNEIFG